MNFQAIFDKAVGAIIEQGEPSYEGESCRYRLGHLKCAVGHLIPDEAFKSEYEGQSANTLFWAYPHLLDVIAGFTLSMSERGKLTHMLQSLQSAHDDYSTFGEERFPTLFEDRCKAIAKELSLEWNFPE